MATDNVDYDDGKEGVVGPPMRTRTTAGDDIHGWVHANWDTSSEVQAQI